MASPFFALVYLPGLRVPGSGPASASFCWERLLVPAGRSAKVGFSWLALPSLQLITVSRWESEGPPRLRAENTNNSTPGWQPEPPQPTCTCRKAVTLGVWGTQPQPLGGVPGLGNSLRVIGAPYHCTQSCLVPPHPRAQPWMVTCCAPVPSPAGVRFQAPVSPLGGLTPPRWEEGVRAAGHPGSTSAFSFARRLHEGGFPLPPSPNLHL